MTARSMFICLFVCCLTASRTPAEDKVMFVTPQQEAERKQLWQAMQAENHELRQKLESAEKELQELRSHVARLKTTLDQTLETARALDRDATRSWTSADGGRVFARLGAIQPDSVELISLEGQRRSIPLDRLSEEDREFVRQVGALRAAEVPAGAGDDSLPTLSAVEILRVPAEP